jgi:hypothetical protein
VQRLVGRLQGCGWRVDEVHAQSVRGGIAHHEIAHERLAEKAPGGQAPLDVHALAPGHDAFGKEREQQGGRGHAPGIRTY